MSSRQLFQTTVLIVLLWLPAATVQGQQDSLQKQIESAKSGGSVSVAAGSYAEPLSIVRPVSIKGASRDEVVCEVTANQPALTVAAKRPVTIDSVTIKWQLASSDATGESATAVLVKDAHLTLRNCRIVALGNAKRSPMAVSASGFSHVKIENCEFEGFDFTIGYSGGAEGSVTESIIRDMGHCGISVYTGSTVRVSDNVITGSKYHGVRCTGGEMQVFNNLIVNNANRGIYLGNKSASGRVRNNVIMGNATGIGAFANSDVAIQNNLILNSEFAGLGTRNSCKIMVKNNIFQGNAQGIVQFAEGGRSMVKIAGNCFWDNETPAKDIQLPKTSMMTDPQLADVANGQFAVTNAEVQKKRHGLTKTEPFTGLWEKWTQLRESPAGAEVSAAR